jgi:hypothetical protein
MLKFEWKTYGEGDKFIEWEATWDGNHDDSWYKPYSEKMDHPFSKTVDFEQMACFNEENPETLRKVGDVVANNPITLAYCEILSNASRIPECTGNTHPYSYYMTLIGNLSNLWD